LSKEAAMKKLIATSLFVFAPFLVPAAAMAGPECQAFGSNGYVVNWHSMIDQSDATLKSVVGLGGNLCGPASAAHVLAGFDDHPRMPSSGDSKTAGFNDVDVNMFGSIVRKLGLAMGTNRTLFDIDLVLKDVQIKQPGTMAWDVAAPVKSSLANSFYSFGGNGAGGTLPTNYWSSYSGMLPTYFSADTLAEPICADVSLQGRPNPGGAEYDYVKTQALMSYGYFSIAELNAPYPCGDWYSLGLDQWCLAPTGIYSVIMTGGHFVSVVGGYDNGSRKYIAIANPHNSLYWSKVRQISVSVAGLVNLFDHAGTVYDPASKHANETKIVSSYTVTRVRHGGKCAAGTLAMSGTYRGSCVQSSKP
jgi:hypothetical protein